ncbi:HAMP domain-containing protein [Dechloromonas sp. H13]|uniref:HAMP domain-containing protein n=1 Tax=Dechloromonas sp. H13 TaxID=2570193 RepID=UPI0012910CF7|nr:HAMP domain-containing protein [Dechloromonas sp. H13]
MPGRHQLSLHTRISLVLTGLAAAFLLALAGLWLQGARTGIHEEVEAANRVSLQWLKALTAEMQGEPPAAQAERVLGTVRPLGRIRANALEVFAADGRLLYRSPPPTYKAGRSVPGWFAAVLAPGFAPRALEVGSLRLVLTPDASRSLIDAWDDLLAMAGWALLLLAALFAATRRALDRALRPLAQVMLALDRTGAGRFDTRLPVFATPELGRISRAFNGMADRLVAAVDANVQLETEREVSEHLQARLEAQRRVIARELHDELAQGITAVRALAGAIVQRSAGLPAVHSPAQGIVAVTGELQDGVRGILHRLRPPAGGLATTLERTLVAWQLQHEEIALDSRLALGAQAVGDEVAQAVVRIVQEGLTNVVRHARASRVELDIRCAGGALHVALRDDGRGRDGRPSPQAGSGLGLTGMGERVALLGGDLRFENPAGGGFALHARLPLAIPVEETP